MATIDRQLKEKLLADPGARYHVIVRTDSDASRVAERCAQRGITVNRTFSLVPGLALTATGEEVLSLEKEPHVTHIELDQAVHASGQ